MGPKMAMKLATILIGVLMCAGCGKPAHPESGPDLQVLVTLPPQADLVHCIGGDRVFVTTLVPEGHSPHTYEPVPSQMRAAAEARVWFTVGSGVEYEVVHGDTVLQQNASLRQVDTHVGILLRGWASSEAGPDACEHNEHHDHAEHGGHHDHVTDPHVWLTPDNARVMADNTLEGLIAVDPMGEAVYRDGHAALVADLDALHEQLKAQLAPLAGETLLVYHPSWGYFADTYGLEQVAIEEEGRKPGVAAVSTVVELARRQQVDVVFASPQSDASSAQVVAAEIGGRVVRVDPLAADFRSSMRAVADALASTGTAP